MPVITASRLAIHLIHGAKKMGFEVTNLKLQKLLYYSQAWHVAITGQPLFADPIEAWVHGPVVASVFGEYKNYRWAPLQLPGPAPLVEEGVEGYPLKTHLEEVLLRYGHFTGPQLESLTHQEPPWVDARRGLPPDVPSRAIISIASMRRYFEPRVMRG